MSSESHRRVQLIRAELSSKSSSERLSESPSKLSSHQIPRCLGSGGPLQLKGCIFSHSALHFDFGVEQACSAAARVLLASPSRASPSSASSRSAFLPYEAFPHAEERRLRIRASCGSALPSSGPTSPFLSSSMRVQYLLGGGRTCFPDRECVRLPVHCCIALFFCLLPDQVVRAWPGGALFSVWLDWSFISKLERWFSGCSRSGLCCPGIHSLEPTKTGQATPGVSGLFSSSHQGEERARIPAEFRARIFKPLGSSGALREKNASRPPAVVDSPAALAFDEAALRPPAVVDSLAALAFNKAWRRASLGASAHAARSTESRGWIDNLPSAALQGMRER